MNFKGRGVVGRPGLKKYSSGRGYFYLPYLLTLFSFVVLYYFRSIDDNRLTSWSWVFENEKGWRVYIALVAGFLPAYLIYRLKLDRPWFFLPVSFIVSVVFFRTPEAIVDASRYFTQAKHLELYGVGFFVEEWGGAIDNWTDLPLVPFLYGLVFRFAGESRLYIQILNALMFTATVFLTYLLGRDLFDKEVGAGGGMMLLGMPYLFAQVPLMLVDVPSMFFLALSVYSFNRAMNGGTLISAFSVAAIFFAVFSKYSLWPMLSVLLAVIFVKRKEGGLKRGLLILTLAAILSSLVFLYEYKVFSSQIRFLAGYQAPGLKRWTESFASTFLFQMHPFIAVFAVLSFFRAAKVRDARFLIIGLLSVLMVLFDIERSRYLIPLFPFVALMASYGLRDFYDETRRAVCSNVITYSVIIAVFAYLPFLTNISAANLRSAGKFLDSLGPKTAKVYVLPQESSVNPAVSVSLLDIYMEKDIHYKYEKESYAAPTDYETSSLRFTWDYSNPPYYRVQGEGEDVIVIISGQGSETPDGLSNLLAGFPNVRKFIASEGVFRYRTEVDVYYR